MPLGLFFNLFSLDDEPAARLGGRIIRGTTAAEPVDSNTALGLSAYYAALRAISEDVAKLPIEAFEQTGPNTKERRPEHPAEELLNRNPNPESSPKTFRENMTAWTLGWGGSIAEIERNGAGEPIALWSVHPSRVSVGRSQEKDENGRRRILYCILNDDLTQTIFRQEDIFHVRGLGDSLNGYSILHMASESLGLGLAAQRFGAAFFGNGANLGSVLQVPGKLTDKAHDNLRKSWATAHQTALKSGGYAILEQGTEYKQFALPPDQAQFLETRNFTIEEFSRWFRITPHKLQHLVHATFSNVTELNRVYVPDTLGGWMVTWEQEAKRKLINPNTQKAFFVRHDTMELLRGDLEARGNFYTQMHGIGAINANQIAAREDMPPQGPDGDTYWIQENMAPVGAKIARAPETDNEDNEDRQQNRRRRQTRSQIDAYAEANTPVVADIFARHERKADKARAAGIKKHGEDTDEFGLWASEFYPHIGTRLSEDLDAPTIAFINMFNPAGSDLASFAEAAFIDWWVSEMKFGALQEKPLMAAENYMYRIKSAIMLGLEKEDENAA